MQALAKPATACLRQAPRQLSRRSRGFVSSTTLRAKDAARIVEVGPRDGLQNEKTTIPLATKIELIERLAGTGLQTIEAGSFVAAKWVPQMANSSEILEKILAGPPPSPHPITYQWLLPNMKGLQNFFAVQPSPAANSEAASKTRHEISIFMAATESFSKKNTNCTIAESLDRFRPLFAEAKTQKTPVRAYISVALGCPYEGPNVSPTRVAELAAELLEMGADEVSVADTTGMGTAPRTQELLKQLSAAGIQNQDLALHFHDTYGQALVNTVVGLEHGVRTFDSAVGGLGGCPFSPGATGNVATEDLVHCLHSLGVDTGVDIGKVAEIGQWISTELSRSNESRAGKATLAKMR